MDILCVPGTWTALLIHNLLKVTLSLFYKRKKGSSELSAAVKNETQLGAVPKPLSAIPCCGIQVWE